MGQCVFSRGAAALVGGARLDRWIWSNARASISPYHMNRRERAFGGCLGVRCRRRTRYTAKSPGEACAAARAGGIRMGKPGARSGASPCRDARGEPGEVKHLSSPRRGDNSASSGERKRISPNRHLRMAGLEDRRKRREPKPKGLGRPAGGGESPVGGRRTGWPGS